MLRISERFTKFAIKREQKKFTFYAERGQIGRKTCMAVRKDTLHVSSQRKYLMLDASQCVLI